MKKTIIEVNGIKMEVDLRYAKKIENYHVGDAIKVLIKGYNENYDSHIGVILGFDDFEKMPTIVISYLEIGYSGAELHTVSYNQSSGSDIQIAPLNEWDAPVTKSQVIGHLNNEIEKKEAELRESKNKKRQFEEIFAKYFDRD